MVTKYQRITLEQVEVCPKCQTDSLYEDNPDEIDSSLWLRCWNCGWDGYISHDGRKIGQWEYTPIVEELQDIFHSSTDRRIASRHVSLQRAKDI